MTRCSSTRKGPCRTHPKLGHCCKLQRGTPPHKVVVAPTYEMVHHRCRCGEEWRTSRALSGLGKG